MELYVLRHGKVPANDMNIIAGNSSEELTEIGICQSEEAREKLKDVIFDVIFCSPVQRTIQTAEIVNVHNVNIILDERISEREVGNLLGKNRHEICFETWNSLELDITPEGAETLGAVLKRVKKFLDEISLKYKDQKVLIVTHSLVCKCIWILQNNISDKQKMDEFVQDNGEIRKYTLGG